MDILEKEDYGFLDHEYYDYYNNDPLYVIMINEQFKILRESFYELEIDDRNILDYFILQNNKYRFEFDLDLYIKKLRNMYLKNYDNYD